MRARCRVLKKNVRICHTNAHATQQSTNGNKSHPRSEEKRHPEPSVRAIHHGARSKETRSIWAALEVELSPSRSRSCSRAISSCLSLTLSLSSLSLSLARSLDPVSLSLSLSVPTATPMPSRKHHEPRKLAHRMPLLRPLRSLENG